MRAVLAALNAKYIHSNPAIYSLKAYAEAFGRETDDRSAAEILLAEYTINQPSDDILMDLYRKQPDFLGFSCYIWNISEVLELAADIARLLPGTQIWLGGPEVSYDAIRLLEECPYIRGIMRGEGEETFRELLICYQRKEQDSGLADIAGITYRDGAGNICETTVRPLLELDALPFPYEGLENFENRIVYYETSRGCPFSCAYCLSSIDKRVRLRSFSLVKRELDFFLEKQVPQVKLIDRTFNCDRKHALQIWHYLAEHDNGVTNFHFEISADLLGEEELCVFSRMRPGLIQLEIGVQSTNPETIREIHRTMRLERLKQMVAGVARGHNIHQHLDLIAGLPGEDYASFRRSYGEVYALEPEQLQLGFLKVLKGSAMWEKAAEYGIVYRRRPPYEVLYTSWLPYEDVMRLKAVEEMTEVYYNSGQFVHTMRALAKEFENPFDLYEALGVYYEKNGLNGKNHSRQARYDILLSFIRERYTEGSAEEQGFRELLVLDLYLREKVKSRPAWAADTGVWREAAADFYREEAGRRRYLDAYEGFQAGQLARMTHLEVFRSPEAREAVDVLRHGKTLAAKESRGPGGPEEGLTEAAEGGYPVLFDYRRKDSLTGQAAVYLLDAADGFAPERTAGCTRKGTGEA